ncbi:MAG TPA: amino acid permease [Verrucomicrobiae bacterium]|jgi:basic amino acid/polyamine antiporter, APA family|nr:amino acid permease [Verrucomicrobiae bacterium]
MGYRRSSVSTETAEKNSQSPFAKIPIASRTERDRQPGLIRALGPAAAMSIVLGTMVGTGIFLKPSEVAANAGVAGWALMAWFLGGGLSLLGALCYVELGSSMPEAGGEYIYLGRGLGEKWGFLFGWTHCMLARPASVAAIAAGCIRFGGFLWPALGIPIETLHFGKNGFDIDYTWGQAASIVVLLAITLVNYLGVREGGRLQIVLTAVKIASVVVIICAGLFRIFGQKSTSFAWTRFSFHGGSFMGFWTAVAATAWAYDGWNDLNLVGSEVENPERNFRRVIVGGVFFVIAIFLLFNSVCLFALPIQTLSRSQNPAADVLATLAGHHAAMWVTLILAVSSLGTLNSSILSGARVDYAMARDGVFFRFASHIHPRFRTPMNALSLQCVLAMVLALTGTFEDLTSLVMFANWMFYAMAVVSMMQMRRTQPMLNRPYRTWGYPFTPVLFVIGAFGLSIGLWMARPVRSSLGLALILSGLVPYHFWQKNRTGPKGVA